MARKDLTITTPRGSITHHTSKSGAVTAMLEWNAGFGDSLTRRFNQAQEFVDSEVLRLSSPYIPLQTGMLQKSGILGTEIGSGEVKWIVPYAAAQYYDTSQSRAYDPQRGGMWFERMKIDHGDQIVKGAQKKARGK